MISYLKNYCNETTLHGFKYFTDGRTHRVEKIFWLLSLLASLISCVFLIAKLTTEVRKTPIVTVISNDPVSIGNIPFPAITFCQEMKFQENDRGYTLLEGFYGKNGAKFVTPLGFYLINYLSKIHKKSIFSFKILHAIDLVMDEDSTLVYNVTVDNEELLDILKTEIFEAVDIDDDRKFHARHTGSWQKQFTLEFAKIITQYGFCSMWNVIEADELLDLKT